MSNWQLDHCAIPTPRVSSSCGVCFVHSSLSCTQMNMPIKTLSSDSRGIVITIRNCNGSSFNGYLQQVVSAQTDMIVLVKYFASPRQALINRKCWYPG